MYRSGRRHSPTAVSAGPCQRSTSQPTQPHNSVCGPLPTIHVTTNTAPQQCLRAPSNHPRHNQHSLTAVSAGQGPTNGPHRQHPHYGPEEGQLVEQCRFLHKDKKSPILLQPGLSRQQDWLDCTSSCLAAFFYRQRMLNITAMY